MELKDLASDKEPVVTAPWPTEPEGMRWIIIESSLLDDEQILLVFEKRYLKEARKVYPDKTIYFPPEIKELSRLKDEPGAIKLMHQVKKKFNGWIVPHHSPLLRDHPINPR